MRISAVAIDTLSCLEVRTEPSLCQVGHRLELMIAVCEFTVDAVLASALPEVQA